MIFWILTIFQLVLLLVGYCMLARVVYIFLSFRGRVPYVPTPREVIRRMVAASGLFQDAHARKVIDLGSGTGKMLFHIARYADDPIELLGVEKSLILHFVAKARWMFNPHRRRIHFVHASWDAVSIRECDYVFEFLTTKGMEALLPKFIKELRKGAIVVSYLFQLPPSPFFEEKKITWGSAERIFLYRKVQ